MWRARSVQRNILRNGVESTAVNHLSNPEGRPGRLTDRDLTTLLHRVPEVPLRVARGAHWMSYFRRRTAALATVRFGK